VIVHTQVINGPMLSRSCKLTDFCAYLILFCTTQLKFDRLFIKCHSLQTVFVDATSVWSCVRVCVWRAEDVGCRHVCFLTGRSTVTHWRFVEIKFRLILNTANVLVIPSTKLTDCSCLYNHGWTLVRFG